MSEPLHITSGDRAGEALAGAGLEGGILVWHDLLYDGPRTPGWPDNEGLRRRAVFIEALTAGGLGRNQVLDTFVSQYERVAGLPADAEVVLWFDGCLFDQSMLVHLITCLQHQGITGNVQLLCIDRFPGIEPYIGLGQLTSVQLGSCYQARKPVSDRQFRFSREVDRVFAERDLRRAATLSRRKTAPLRWVPAALQRWLQEEPDPETGLGRIESMALDAVHKGCAKPWDIFNHVAAAETPPQFWGDTTLWMKINGLAARQPPLVRIEGPASRLPQWVDGPDLQEFTITSCRSSRYI
ncbi:MAG: hypothetical protein P8X86_01025 [Desulfofustis sp.]